MIHQLCVLAKQAKGARGPHHVPTRGSLFSEGLVIGRNFAFQSGFGLSIKPAKNTKITA